jgi:two-component system phosphate regulon sensor histidine kinase PhoR
LWRILGLGAIGIATGLLLDNLPMGLVPVLLIYLGSHLYNLSRLLRWLHEGKKFRPPAAGGIWNEVFEQIIRLQQRNRKRKRSLRRLLKRFHNITVALPDATVELRPDSDEIDWWNSAASRLLGLRYPRDSGQRITNLIRNPVFIEHLQMADAEREFELPSPVNEDVILRMRVVPYPKNRLLLLARDVTRLQRLERTRQDFVANVSHELRSPLTVVSGYLETMLDSGEVDTMTAQLGSMRTQAERMTRLVDDLMLLSRLESEEPRADLDVVRVGPLVRNIAEQARELGAGKHKVTLEVDDSLCIHGVESELYSAFSNLVFNAIRYTPPGGTVAVRWAMVDEIPVFTVVDSGVGIEAQHIARLTERFYRVDTGRSRASGGTGLGLAIVKHVLLRHEARLEIKSKPGDGSTFACHFPPERKAECVCAADARASGW